MDANLLVVCRGVVKVNLSYLKGKRQTWELTSSGWVDKGGDGRYRVPLVDLSGGEGIFNFSLLFHEKSEVMVKWSLLTSDEDRESESIGTLYRLLFLLCVYGKV